MLGPTGGIQGQPGWSRDGSKIAFSSSHEGNLEIYTIKPDGSDLKKVITSASWGSWISGDEVQFVRGTKVMRTKLGSSEETEIMDSEGVKDLDGALLQQPELSSDGKYIAITLRGSKRETGIWNIAKKTWTQTGLGCQINWTPDHTAIYWVHPTGNGGSRILKMPLENGTPPKDVDEDKLEVQPLQLVVHGREEGAHGLLLVVAGDHQRDQRLGCGGRHGDVGSERPGARIAHLKAANLPPRR